MGCTKILQISLLIYHLLSLAQVATVLEKRKKKYRTVFSEAQAAAKGGNAPEVPQSDGGSMAPPTAASDRAPAVVSTTEEVSTS